MRVVVRWDADQGHTDDTDNADGVGGRRRLAFFPAGIRQIQRRGQRVHNYAYRPDNVHRFTDNRSATSGSDDTQRDDTVARR
ncbi:hypothetical protein MRX96_007343 [Rhipicephalus microplus]